MSNPLSMERLSIKEKLRLVITLTSCASLLLACASFLAYEVVASRRAMVRDLDGLAKAIGANSTAALAFGDRAAAREVLGALRTKPQIVSAAIYDSGNKSLARYGEATSAHDLSEPGRRFESGHLILRRDVILEGERIGSVYLEGDMRELYGRMQRYALAVGLVMLVAFAVTVLISSRFEKVISRPILALARAAEVVSTERDYSVRVRSHDRDELGTLTDAFNDMLAQIQVREVALQEARDELERRVEERTRELRREMDERRQAEAALEESEEQLRQSQKMDAMGKLAGGVAHDFNNLLTAIGGYSAIMLRRLSGEDPLRRDAMEIKKACDRASALTRQLLAFSSKQVLQPKILDLNEIVLGMERMLERIIGEDVELLTRLGVGLGSVKADPGQVEQVILNLAVNARDAMPEGGRLTISTAKVESGSGAAGGQVLLEVSDSGCGMDEETKNRIFEPFFTTKPKGKGTGLGLATVYGIVRQSGGTIAVDSVPGQGTSFKVWLPRVSGVASESGATEGEEGRSRGSETVLLVEDEELVRDLTGKILELQGYRVLTAPDGAAALEVCERCPDPIDLMLTDVVMPNMNGSELRERACTLRPEMKVLFMSGYTDQVVEQHGIHDSGAAFIQKPFTPTVLVAKVRAILDDDSPSRGAWGEALRATDGCGDGPDALDRAVRRA